MSTPLEHDLETLHQTPAPDPAFAARLQRDLYARAERLEAPRPTETPRPLFAGGLFRRAWVTGALAFVLILAAVFTLTDPQRVWAGIQRFFRYVPGVGFVDLENARALPAPVAVEREGITFIVTQVLATTDRTMVRFEVQGLPPADQIWPKGGELNDDFRVQLRLSEGTTLDSGGMMLGLENGRIEFPPLPADTDLVTLEFNHIPLTPPGMFPEQWTIPLTLQPLEGEPDTALFPEPYAPENATDTHFGITATVLQVAQASEGTAVQIQLASESPIQDLYPWWDGQLRDDVGHVYSENYEANGSMVETMVVSIEEAQEQSPQNNAPFATTQTMLFYPVSDFARQLTFEIPKIEIGHPVTGSFTIDLGDTPQIGDVWALNLPIEIDGVTAHIVSAHLAAGTLETEEGIQNTKILEFFIQAETGEDGRYLGTLSLVNSQGWFTGWGTDISEPGSSSTYLIVEEGHPFPRGELKINFERVNIVYPGPWILTWPVPRGENDPDSSFRPVILHPDARDTQNDLTLSISETVQTDRLFALSLEVENLPPGTEFLQPMPWGTNRFNHTQITLRDNLGNAATPSYYKISWQPYQNNHFTQTPLNFTPPSPLASNLTLNIPAVHLFMRAKTSFDIALPPDRVPIQETLEDWSDLPPEGAWEVDIPLEIAGFQVHFTHAWLEGDLSTQTLVLYTKDVTGQVDNFYLTELHMETIQTPDGKTWNVPPYPATFGSAGQIPGTSTSYVMLRIEAFDPDQPALLPGTYHVQLNGVLVTVPGPWELGWDLLGP